MDLMKKIIISVPFISADQFKSDVQKLIDLDCETNFIEVRFDYWEGELSDDLIHNVIHYLHSKQFKMIFTYTLQGEQTPSYISLLQRLISHKPDYIDLDTNIMASTLTVLAELAMKNDVAILYSYHNRKNTPPLVIISELCEFLIQLLPIFFSNSKHILKMVFMARSPKDAETILKFCTKYGDQGFNLISFCMGELGANTRIQSIINGCTYTYAYIGKPTALGQLHITEMKKYLLDNPLS